MDRHWLFDRTDPRTALVISVGFLLVGLLAVVAMVGEGGLLAAFALTWALLALVQVASAAVRLRRFHRAREHGTP